jgi:hypothetical protein
VPPDVFVADHLVNPLVRCCHTHKEQGKSEPRDIQEQDDIRQSEMQALVTFLDADHVRLQLGQHAQDSPNPGDQYHNKASERPPLYTYLCSGECFTWRFARTCRTTRCR